MQLLRLSFRGPDVVVEELQLRIPQASGVIDPKPFRARARGEGAPLVESFARSDGMRSLHTHAGSEPELFDLPGNLLTFLLSGGAHIDLPDGTVLALESGDLFLVEGERPQRLPIYLTGECRLLQLRVGADWPGERVRSPRPRGEPSRPEGRQKFLRMFTGQDDRSYFRDFNALFGPPGRWSSLKPLVGFRFIGMAEDTFIDWHPEVVNNLVIVLTGGLELETGGAAGRTEIFWPGDVCLAEDRTGEGHIDRVHGFVQVAVLIIDTEQLWP